MVNVLKTILKRSNERYGVFGIISLPRWRSLKITTLLALTICLMFLGCNTERWCFKKYPPEIRTDTMIFESTIYRDTTIYEKIEADTVFRELRVEIPCEEMESRDLRSDTLHARTEYANANAWIENGILKLELIQNDTLLTFRLDSVIQIKDRYEHLYTTEIHKQPPEKKIRIWDKIKFIGLGFIFGFSLAGFIFALKKR